MEIDPETRKHALRSGQSVDTEQDRESRIERFEAIRDQLESKKGASNGGRRQDGSTNGRLTPPEPAYRPVGTSPDRDAPGRFERARPSGEYEYSDSPAPRANRREPRDFREAPGRGSESRRQPARVDTGPKGGDKGTTGQEVPGPLDDAWEKVKDTARRALAYAGFDVTGDADSLTESEAEVLVPRVAEFIKYVGTGIDLALTHLNARHEESDIWQFEDHEANQLAIIYLKRARKVGWMAQVARQVHHVKDASELKDVGFIVGKRIGASVGFVASNGGMQPWLK